MPYHVMGCSYHQFCTTLQVPQFHVRCGSYVNFFDQYCMCHYLYYGVISYIQHAIVPLEVAAASGHTETVEKLITKGANIEHENKVSSIHLTFSNTVRQCCISEYMTTL